MGEGSRYCKVTSKFWQDEAVLRWSDDAKLLALYLMTCPHRNMVGYFVLPKPYICADLDWSMERLAEPFRELFEEGFCAYDEETRVLPIHRALKYDSPGDEDDQEKDAQDSRQGFVALHPLEEGVRPLSGDTVGFACACWGSGCPQLGQAFHSAWTSSPQFRQWGNVPSPGAPSRRPWAETLAGPGPRRGVVPSRPGGRRGRSVHIARPGGRWWGGRRGRWSPPGCRPRASSRRPVRALPHLVRAAHARG